MVLSPTRGATLIEVKGGRIETDGGRWKQYDRPIPDPFEQVIPAKHALVRYLRSAGVHMGDFWIDHAVALPDVTAVPKIGLGPHADRDRVFCIAHCARRRRRSAPPSTRSSSTRSRTCA